MRVRIRKAVAGFREDISLSHLTPGQTYELDAALATYLIAMGAAEAVHSPPRRTPEDIQRALEGIAVDEAVKTIDHPRSRRTDRPPKE